MDKSKNKRYFPILENSGYSIEYGNTTYRNTLEQRIQYAKAASSITKQEHKQNVREKVSLTINTNITSENDITNKKTTNSSQELKKKSKQYLPKLIKTYFFSQLTILLLIIPDLSNLQYKNSSDSFKPNCKGGLMQHRLEAIKAQKLSNVTSRGSEKNTLQSNKSSKIVTQITTQTKNHVSSQVNINVPLRNEYKTRSTVQKHLYSEPSTISQHCDRTKNNSNPSSKLKYIGFVIYIY